MAKLKFFQSIVIGLVVLVVLSFTWSCTSKSERERHPFESHHQHTPDGQHDRSFEAVKSMTDSHHHLGPHFKWTTLRFQTPEDLKRADEIVQILRKGLAPYQDYRVAIQDGFEPFLPHIAQPKYHFTKKWYGFKAAFTFNPAQPTSLLYRKTSDGYQLIGAMYTARKGLSENRLDERVPLSVARWHAHVNICLPPRGKGKQADWTRLGFRGSITTEAECDAAGGRFYPQIFGWMLHVYPFERTPEKIWSH